MQKVLVLATVDDANWGYNLKKIFELQGYETIGLKLAPHGFEYPAQLEVSNIDGMREACLWADMIIFPQMEVTIFYECYDKMRGKKIGVCHGGSFFRKYMRFCQDLFNTVLSFQWIIELDLWKAGTENQFYTCVAVDTEILQPDYTYHGMTIRHSPSSDDRKGTPEILDILRELKEKYPLITVDVSSDRLPWEENIKRVNAGDIYIDELQAYSSDGHILGSWGMSAIEAAALGKIVVSNHFWNKQYSETYGVEPMIQVANSREEMYKTLERLISMSEAELLALKQNTRDWAEKYHSLKATGDRAIPIIKELCQIV